MIYAEALRWASFFIFLLRSFTTKERVKDVERLLITWEIGAINCDTVKRYCPGCGGKAVFEDSLKRRRNANGKMIFEYAIYKCDQEHTWNRLSKTYNAKQYDDNPAFDDPTSSPMNVEVIRIEDCFRMGFTEIEIFIKKIEGDWRLDKMLARYLEGISRSQIEKKIKSGKILVDHEIVKTKTMVKEGQVILVFL